MEESGKKVFSHSTAVNWVTFVASEINTKSKKEAVEELQDFAKDNLQSLAIKYGLKAEEWPLTIANLLYDYFNNYAGGITENMFDFGKDYKLQLDNENNSSLEHDLSGWAEARKRAQFDREQIEELYDKLMNVDNE